MELPVAIEVSGEIDGSELYDSLCHLLGPAHAGALHPVFDQVLASTFAGATGYRPAVGEVVVIAHPDTVSVEIISDCLQSFAFGSGKAAFGDTLADPLDHLTKSPSKIRRVRSRTQSSASRLPSAWK